MIEKIKRIYRKLFKNTPHYKITYKTKTERHGTVYGGWNIITNSINSESVVYSFGIGEDISFDLSLVKKYGCFIHAFDPTPRVEEWLSQKVLPQEFIYHPIALSHENGTLTFYSPEDSNSFSHTLFSKPKSKAVEVICQNLKTITQNLGHTSIDLLKIDIEGFEYEVIDNVLKSSLRPKQFLIEFHHFFPEFSNEKTESMILKLEKYGYHLFDVSDSFCEYSFIFS